MREKLLLVLVLVSMGFNLYFLTTLYGVQRASLKREKEEIKACNCPTLPPFDATQHPIARELLPPLDSKPNTVRRGSTEKRAWRANFAISQVEKHLVLTESEREQLREQFMAGRTLSDLESILGRERAKLFEEQRERAYSQAEEEEIQNELFRLSRKLNLSEEQERELGVALRAVNVALRPNREKLVKLREEANSLHSNPPDDGAQLRSLYDEMQLLIQETRDKEKELLIQEVQGFLSDEQLNLLVEDLSK